MRIGLTNPILRFVTIGLGAFFLLFSLFVYDSMKERRLPSGFVCENVVVLTGGKDRIKLALNSAKQFKARNVFISGVYKNTKLEDILSDKDVGDVSVILGYKALNTEGNAKEIHDVSEDLGMKEIVLVTSDYHMFRSLYEVKKYNKGLKIYPVKVKSDFDFKFISLCVKEFYCSLGILIRDGVKGLIYD